VVHEVLRSAGAPLDAATRAFFEPRFGHDFSRVRVHADDRAAVSAQAVNALAYTVGFNIVFGSGQYSGGTRAGRQLLAHELVHVMQQDAAPVPDKLTIGSAHSAPEAEADLLSNAIDTSADGRELIARNSAPPANERPRLVANLAPGVFEKAPKPLLQRKLLVNPNDSVPMPPGIQGPPPPLTLAIQGLLGETCPDGHFQVNGTSGDVAPKDAKFCRQPPPKKPALSPANSSTPVGCGCVCDSQRRHSSGRYAAAGATR
jgi:hypothetical protein